MTDDSLKEGILKSVAELKKQGKRIVLVHGGGPVIKRLLENAGVSTEFKDGHRVTDKNAMRYVEMALSASVNKDLVRILLNNGVEAVGISGKDGGTAKAVKRYHQIKHKDGSTEKVDIGYVGDVKEVNPNLLNLLLDQGYLPVLSPVSIGMNDGMDYNINADVFAGTIAGALKAEFYVVLTDVDGIMRDINDPKSVIASLTSAEIEKEGSIIKGGMIPKVESCLNALHQGAGKSLILNGMKPESLQKAFLKSENIGTQITL